MRINFELGGLKSNILIHKSDKPGLLEKKPLFHFIFREELRERVRWKTRGGVKERILNLLK